MHDFSRERNICTTIKDVFSGYIYITRDYFHFVNTVVRNYHLYTHHVHNGAFLKFYDCELWIIRMRCVFIVLRIPCRELK